MQTSSVIHKQCALHIPLLRGIVGARVELKDHASIRWRSADTPVDAENPTATSRGSNVLRSGN
jgi:hypothetical protein